ncbi:hypothetical protein Q4I32_007033 [Leishmania shawi]|uniref:Uncharacterized protein n=1 Tax=Leishmania shawi TaxID=5680 RepID=A0AAW3BD88_9TRYP
MGAAVAATAAGGNICSTRSARVTAHPEPHQRQDPCHASNALTAIATMLRSLGVGVNKEGHERLFASDGAGVQGYYYYIW